MHYFKRITLYLLLLVLATGVYAQTEVKFKSLDDMLPMNPKVKVGTLPNGLKYYIMENKKPEKRAEFMIALNAGAIFEDDDQKGLAHFIEHMCFNGTKNFPKNELVSFLESTGVRFGADLNAMTSYDKIIYMVTVPVDKEGMIDKGLQVLEDWGHNVSFDPEELEKERGVIMEEWRLYRGAQERMQRDHAPFMFYKSKYADRSPIGDTAIIKNAPREAFLRYYKDWFRPDLMAIIAVGDINSGEIEKIIKEKFSRIEMVSNPRKAEKPTLPDHKETLVSIAKDKELPYSLIAMYFKHAGRTEGTYRSYRLSIADGLMSSMLSQRMAELTRKAPPPYMFAQANEGNFIGGKRVFNLLSVVNTGGFLPGTAALLTEAFRAEKHGFTQSELDRAKEDALRNIEKSYEERDKTESKPYAMECTRNFTDDEGMPGIAYELGLYQKFLPEITLDEINNLVKKLISKENLVITISAPDKPNVPVPTKAEILAVFDSVSKSNITAYEDKVSKEPLMAEKPKPGKVVDEKINKDLGTTEWKLSNGIKVVLKPTDFKNDEIILTAFSPGGTSVVSDKEYVSASSADDIVNESGIAKYNATELEKMLAGKIVSIQPYISNLNEGLNGSCSPKDIETFMQLINLYFTAPRQDEEAFQSYLAQTMEGLKNRNQDPNNAFMDSILVTMANYHFRARPQSIEYLKELDYNKAFKIYQDRFSDAGEFTFILVGSFKPEEVKPFFEQYIASLPATKRNEKWKDVNMRYPTGVIKKEVRKGIENKSTVRLIFTGQYDYNADNNYLLSSLIEVLNIRMREAVREDKGGTYGVYARPQPQKYPFETYRIDINFGTDPKRVDELEKTVVDVIKELQDKLVDIKYVNNVKEMQKREREVSLKTNNFWIGVINSYLQNDIDLMQILNYSNRVENLKPEDIQKAAQRYLNLNNFAKIVMYPEK
jgi:zinc protease